MSGIRVFGTMHLNTVLFAFLVVATAVGCAEPPNKKALGVALQEAMASEDVRAVREAAAVIRRALGDKAGVPEVADK